MKNNRRDFIKLASMAGIGLTGSGIIAAYAEQTELKGKLSPDNTSSLVPFNRFPRMVQEYFVDRVREIEKVSEKRRNNLKTKSDAEAYVREVRFKIEKCFGPWPEKTPLNPRTVGTIERDAYHIEKVIFDSRPGFPVTANLYIPKGRDFPLPAVVGTCGHSNAGKAEPVYQAFAQSLARQGYVVLIFDPIGQGERIQYLSEDFKSIYGIGVGEHIYAGNQMILNGESLSSWFAWDGIRCVDYLLGRPEVDPRHIGITGNSGGGTQATWLCGVEPRISMAAPSCFVIGFGQNLENEEAADMEQCPPAVLSMGLDHLDFIDAMAPKPVILLSQEKDFFDVRGAEESFAELKKLYKLLGAEDNIQLFVGPVYHGFSAHNREAMYKWFNKATKKPNPKVEPALITETEESLWCTPKGQVAEMDPPTVFSFTRALSQSLSKKRTALNGDALNKVIISTLRLPLRTGVPNYRILRSDNRRLYPKKFAATYAVETEPGVFSLVYRLNDEALYSRPPLGLKKALLYVSHHSADNELRSEDFLKELIRDESGSAVFACDVRGIGESKPNTCRDNFLDAYGNDYFYASYSRMLDYPYIGQKTYDILRLIDWIKSMGHEEIHLVAKGWGAIPATFAALLSKPVTQVTLKNALSSYTDIAENEEYNWPLSVLLPGVLKSFDMPDCYRNLSSKKLHQIEPWSALAGGKIE